MTPLVGSVYAVTGDTVAAAIVGLALGVGMFAVVRMSVRFVTPDAPEIGVARALALNMLAMGAAFGALAVAFLFARTYLTAFGLGLVVGFVVPSLIALFTMSGVTKALGSGR